MDSLKASELLGVNRVNNLIVVGDLNFNLSPLEIWGSSVCLDHLVEYFSNLVHGTNLIDVLPVKVEPFEHWLSSMTPINDKGVTRRQMSDKC